MLLWNNLLTKFHTNINNVCHNAFKKRLRFNDIYARG